MRAYVVIAIILASSAPAAAQAVDDTKLWLSGTGEADITENVQFGGSLELRSGSDSGFDQIRAGLEVGFKLHRYVGLDLFYVLMSRDGNAQLRTPDETRHRVGTDINLRYDTDRLTLGNRVRLQHTTYEFESDHDHIRDKVHAGYEVVKHVTPYVALEFIYLVNPKAEYRETRYYIGVDWHAAKRFDVGAYFMRQIETNVNIPEHNTVIGLEATYLFRKVKKTDRKPEPGDHD